MSEYLAKAGTSFSVSWPVFQFLYGDKDLITMGTKIPLPVALAAGASVGYLLSDVVHENLLPTLNISERFSAPISSAVNIGANGLGIVGTMAAMNPASVGNLDTMKLAGGATASAVLSHYAYQNWIRPMWFGDQTGYTY